MAGHQNIPHALCRDLAHALRRLFKSVKTQNLDGTLSHPIDIIRRIDNKTPHLPHISTVSLFPDFENPDFDTCVPQKSVPPPTNVAGPRSRRTLLPATSLSHFNLNEAYSNQSKRSVSRRRGSKRHSSLEKVDEAAIGSVLPRKPALVHQRSSLLVQRQSLYANPKVTELSLSESSAYTVRRRSRSGDLRKSAKTQSFRSDQPPLTPVPEQSCSSVPAPEHESAYHMVKHFASFCVIDTSAPGCPISAVSEDLQYLYDIKDRFVLNAHECSELSMDVSVGYDPDGNEVTYVLLFSPLVSALTSKHRFIMVSAIDVSGYIGFAASLDPSPEKGEALRPSNVTETPRSRPNQQRASRPWIDERTDQIADELLHGCSISDSPNPYTRKPYEAPDNPPSLSTNHDPEDIWTAIAREEGLMYRSRSSACKSTDTRTTSQQATTPSPSSCSKATVDYGDEKVLDRFVRSLQLLYSEYFLLACTPSNDQFYEICYVSPAVYSSGEWISGHLSHTPANLMQEFASHLAAGRRFRTRMRWGNEGVQKKLYCVPLIGSQPATWICMLVDKETDIQW